MSRDRLRLTAAERLGLMVCALAVAAGLALMALVPRSSQAPETSATPPAATDTVKVSPPPAKPARKARKAPKKKPAAKPAQRNPLDEQF